MNSARLMVRRTAWLFAVIMAMSSIIVHASPVTISPRQAAQHVGEQVTVKGRVVVVYTAPHGETYLNFGAEYPNQLISVLIDAAHADQFPTVHDLEGRIVKVSGVIRLHRGKPEIVVERPDQLREWRLVQSASK
ncbi:MAG TPA: hypothetical protein VG962_03555 [Steroidobacteraceae bacterium]|nr:hypothetical protein [Steroidobacteraceae bacterium]